MTEGPKCATEADCTLVDMAIVAATGSDFEAFLELASEVEDLFGAMVSEASFHDAVRRNILRGSALVARQPDGATVGALLFSRHRRPTYRVGWLVVARRHRSRGIGRTLLGEAFRRWVKPPCAIEVVTFGPDHPGAEFRGFYERLGFEPAELADGGPEDGSRQVFRLAMETLPAWAVCGAE